MTVGELKKLLANVPDDAIMFHYNRREDDIDQIIKVDKIKIINQKSEFSDKYYYREAKENEAVGIDALYFKSFK